MGFFTLAYEYLFFMIFDCGTTKERKQVSINVENVYVHQLVYVYTLNVLEYISRKKPEVDFGVVQN